MGTVLCVTDERNISHLFLCIANGAGVLTGAEAAPSSASRKKEGSFSDLSGETVASSESESSVTRATVEAFTVCCERPSQPDGN